MQAIETITNLKNIFQISPLRNSEGIQIPLNYSDEDLHKIDTDLEILKDKCITPLKVVLMGEVKAGKSTLLNALAGALVAPTDITETTASIMLISYGEKAAATIFFNDGTKVDGSPEEIFVNLSQHQNDQDYFSRCDHVEVKLPLNALKKLQIVDTPGLATLTEANAQRTENFFQQADVALWVLNGHYLGQSDINAELEQVAEMGKPIIGIINRIDEIEGDKLKLVRYVKRELGIYLKAVFPLSAKQAYEAITKGKEQDLKNSGYTDLAYYLEHNIERQADTVQNESLISSAQALAGKELLLHQAVLTDLDSKLLIIKHSYEKMKQQSDYIRRNQENLVKAWFREEFLADKERYLLAQIKNISLINLGSGSDRLTQSISESFSEKAIHDEIGAFLVRLNDSIRNDWQERLHLVQDEVVKENDELLRRHHIHAQQIMDQLPNAEKSALDSAGQGIMAGGVFGGAIAAYAAWLGPAAAHISIGAAMSAFMPPFLLAGVATGVVMGLVKHRNIKSEYGLLVAKNVEEIRRDIEAKILPEILEVIKNACQEFVESCHCRLIQDNFDGHPEEEVLAIKAQLEQYIRVLEGKLNI